MHGCLHSYYCAGMEYALIFSANFAKNFQKKQAKTRFRAVYRQALLRYNIL